MDGVVSIVPAARGVMTPEIVAVASARDARARAARNKSMAAGARSVNNVRGRAGRWMNRDGGALAMDVRLGDRQAWRNEREKPNQPRRAQHDSRKTKSAASHSSLPFTAGQNAAAVMHNNALEARRFHDADRCRLRF